MNILREFRHATKKSLPTRIVLVLLFSVILIINTYAWWSTAKDVKSYGLEGDITSWDVEYYADGEKLDKEVTFTIEELYPGMPNREDVVRIYNIGKASTKIRYELVAVKVFGQDVLTKLKDDGDVQTSGNTTNVFSDDTTYPFNISFTYDKDTLVGKYVDDTTTPNAGATFKFNAGWIYEGSGTSEENEAKDILDTKFGKDAYSFYNDDEANSLKAIEITVRITSEIWRDDI